MDQFVSGTPDWIKGYISKASELTGVPSVLLSAQIKQESGFNPTAGSVAGAVGVSQFITSTAQAYGLRVDEQVDERLDPEKAVMAQALYMKDLLKQYGSAERALSAYNSGNPDRYKDKTFKTWYGSVGETNKYVKNITRESGVTGSLALNPPQRKPVLEKRKVEIAKATMPKMPIPRIVPTPTVPMARQTAQAPQQQREPFSLVPQAHAQTPMQQNIPTPAPTPMQNNYRQPTYPAPVPTPTPSGPMSVARGGQSGFAQSNQPQRVPTPSVARSYTVRSGDTLWGIAQQQLGSGSRWRELGFGGDPRKLPVGQVLKY